MRRVIDMMLIIAITIIIISLVFSLSANGQPEKTDIEQAILIILQARYAHVYWWERLEWDKTTPTEYIGDREVQAKWIAAYDQVLTVLYAQMGTKYYAYDYLQREAR